MAIDPRLMMTDAAPIAQGLQSVGQGISGMMGQKRQMDLNKLAGQALMGDTGAMESLTMQAPDVAMGIQDRQRRQAEQEQQQQMQRQKALQGELVELAPGIASAPDLQTANARIRSELATGAYPLATSLAGDDGELDEQEWAMFKDIAAQQEGGTRFGKSEILDDGTMIVATSRGPKVYAATGELLRGEEAQQAIREAQEYGAGVQGLRKGEREAAGVAQEEAQSAFQRLPDVQRNISNLEEGVRLLREEGALTGKVRSRLPSLRASSQKLDQLQRQLGLDVLRNTTFGALSEKELQFALKAGLNTDLPPDELAEELERRIEAQRKLADYVSEAAQFLSRPETTLEDWMRLQQGRQSEQGGAQGQQGGEIELDADTQSLLDKYGA